MKTTRTKKTKRPDPRYIRITDASMEERLQEIEQSIAGMLYLISDIRETLKK